MQHEKDLPQQLDLLVATIQTSVEEEVTSGQIQHLVAGGPGSGRGGSSGGVRNGDASPDGGDTFGCCFEEHGSADGLRGALSLSGAHECRFQRQSLVCREIELRDAMTAVAELNYKGRGGYSSSTVENHGCVQRWGNDALVGFTVR